MKERRGYVVKSNPPRLLIQESLDKKFWSVEFKAKTFPHELIRFKNHQCLPRPGTKLRFVEELGQITDIWFDDIPDVPNIHELSRIVEVVPNSRGESAFASRSCGCSIHVSRKAVISDWNDVFKVGLEIWHRSTVIKGRLEASEIEICIPEGKQAEANQKEQQNV